MIYFFSGTGNSYRIATWLAHAFQTGIQPVAKPIQPATDLLGLVFPTHGFTAPWAVVRFAFALPRGRGRRACVVAARSGVKLGPVFISGTSGSGCFLIAFILWLKGYRIAGLSSVDMPLNLSAFVPGMRESAARAIIGRAQGRMKHFAGTLQAGQRLKPSGRLWVDLFLGLFLLPVSAGYLAAGRFGMAKLLYADDTCTGCGLCAQNCPVDALEMRGEHPRPFWKWGCEFCMRCMAFCPEQAIQCRHGLGSLTRHWRRYHEPDVTLADLR